MRLIHETERVLRAGFGAVISLLIRRAMHKLRPKSLVGLMTRWLLCGLPALSLAAAVSLAQPAHASELALKERAGAGSSRIVLDLRKRQISVMRGGLRLGPWPVAIGDPKTPTPVGDFAILDKTINPVYISRQVRRASGAAWSLKSDRRSISGFPSERTW